MNTVKTMKEVLKLVSSTSAASENIEDPRDQKQGSNLTRFPTILNSLKQGLAKLTAELDRNPTGDLAYLFRVLHNEIIGDLYFLIARIKSMLEES